MIGGKYDKDAIFHWVILREATNIFLSLFGINKSNEPGFANVLSNGEKIGKILTPMLFVLRIGFVISTSKQILL